MRSVRLLEVFSKLIYSFGFLSRELRTQFFIGLAALFSLFTIFYFIDAFLGGKTEQSLDYDAGSLDFAMDWRLSSPEANHDIVIIDIDERSLAIMAEEYGRWPWPRARRPTRPRARAGPHSTTAPGNAVECRQNIHKMLLPE